ncbi:chaplin [Streptomyces sp. NPDC018029]|uniref:chaplin n=1 Tax=Streptomyces sp. NPDC018029 TaxID=3365032 RepID=UPI0037BB4A16
MLSAAAATSILSLSGTHAFAASGANGQALDSPGFLSGNNVQAPVEVPVNVCGNSANAAAAGNPAFGNTCGSSSHSSHSSHSSQSSHSGSHSAPRSAPPRSAESAPKAAPRGNSESANSPATPSRSSRSDTPARSASGSAAQGDTTRSPGVGAGNNAKAPVDAPVKACGNTVGIVAALSPVTGNRCGAGHHSHRDPHPAEPPAAGKPPVTPPGTPVPRPRAATPEDPARPGGPADPRSPEVSSATDPHHVPQGRHARRPVAMETPHDLLAATGTDAALLGAAGASAGLLLGGAILYRRGRASSRR